MTEPTMWSGDIRCLLCGAIRDDHYDGSQCPTGPDTWSATQVFKPEAAHD